MVWIDGTDDAMGHVPPVLLHGRRNRREADEDRNKVKFTVMTTRSSAIAQGPRDASCQLKSYQLPRNSAETTYTTSPDQIDGMKLEI